MVAAVTPPKLSYMETYNTMKYAEGAMEIELQAKTTMLNVNVHMYSALTEEYKQEVEGLQRKLDGPGETENTALEAEVRELKDGLASVTASRDALLRAQETGSGGSTPATRTDGPSTTPDLSLSAKLGPPGDDGRAKYDVEAAWKMYRLRIHIVGEIWDNGTVLRTSLVEDWKPQLKAAICETVQVLQGRTSRVPAQLSASSDTPRLRLFEPMSTQPSTSNITTQPRIWQGVVHPEYRRTVQHPEPISRYWVAAAEATLGTFGARREGSAQCIESLPTNVGRDSDFSDCLPVVQQGPATACRPFQSAPDGMRSHSMQGWLSDLSEAMLGGHMQNLYVSNQRRLL
ncbi:hypothetical protein HPB49_007533 [Dermacentor silvarum]|uniref:Uncharacterized protein n=1 Tax=Dermacentor silvarum TaxID=543639 RepID=A0ACB8DXE3_DERSI|nr:hypothetical protein HPB49_007533 [Dermacentor silvarum]